MKLTNVAHVGSKAFEDYENWEKFNLDGVSNLQGCNKTK